MVRKVLSVLVMTAACMFSAGNASGAGVEFFSPEGTVKNVRQATARFSDQMVAFGDPRLKDPFDVKCPEKGKGRWIDGKNWAYDFEKDLPAGLACRFTLKKGLKTLDGVLLGGKKSFAFNTGGPSVIDSDPYEGSTYIDERQVFLFRLDAPVDEASVLKNVSCSIEGVRERVGIRLITGKERKHFFKATGIPTKDRNVVLFQCRRAFPPRAHVKVIWGKKVRAKSGMTSTADKVIAYQARGPFTAKFRCLKERPQGGCIPLSPMKLYFSAPLSIKDAREISIRTDKKTGRETPWKAKLSDNGADYYESLTFKGPFPEKSSLSVHIPAGLKDISDRVLSNADKFPLAVKTDTYPALVKFSDRFGVIEAKEGAFLPVTVRNIEEQIRAWLIKNDERPRSQQIKPAAVAEETTKKDGPGAEKDQVLKGAIHRVTAGGDEAVMEWLFRLNRTPRERSVFSGLAGREAFTIKRPGGSKEFEVIGIPLKNTGFYVVEIESLMLGSRLLAKPAPMYVPTAALVTNMAAHLKWGRESSLVFVTSLDSGEPVSDASVTLRDCRGGVVWQGETGGDGIARINKKLPGPNDVARCGRVRHEKGFYYEPSRVLYGISEGLFVFARKGGDMTFTHSSWDDGIESWRFNLPERYGSGDEGFIAHTVFDRTLLRVGDTVHMKHFARQRTMQGLVIPEGLRDIREIVIKHVGSGEKYTIPVEWKKNGTAVTEWKIPKGSKLGTYNVFFKGRTPTPGKKRETLDLSGSFRVEEFRVPLMRAFLKGPGEPAVNRTSVDIDIGLRYLSGGGAADYPVKVRSEIERRLVTFPDLDEFTFAAGPVKAGIERYGEDRYGYRGEDAGEDDAPDTVDRFGRRKIRLGTIELNLDKNGAARITLKDLPKINTPHEIVSELEFRDPNGETQTTSARIPLYPAMLHVGLYPGTGEFFTDTLKYQVLVVDMKGKPVEGARVRTKLFKRFTYSHRRRITGGFYAFEHVTDIREVSGHCSGKTAANGILYCEGKSPATGRLIIQAETEDMLGNLAFTNRDVNIYGGEDTWFESRNDDRIELIPEKRFAEPGETMRFSVRMPFREATALVTVEREGVMDAYIRKVTRSDPVVEVPVKDNYVPNVFVSALVVRGRAAGAPATSMFDPGKPAYRLGIAGIRVGWKPHALKVKVATDKKAYAVREKVRAHINVRGPEGGTPPEGGEVTIAVVDEGLLELKPNASWGLLEGMMRRKGYEVATATAQMMVVGKRHFGRKALPHGGGGGKQLTRELFDTLVYWKATVPLDDDGEADITFDLNDSLTSFKVVAIANAGSGLFGTGSETIRTTQDLMLLSGLPALVREGDRFTAGFTVRNTSQREMKVVSTLKMTDTAQRTLEPATLLIPPGEAREALWQITVPHGAGKIEYVASARDTMEDGARDTLKVTQRVVPAVGLRVFQATLAQLKDTFKTDVARPVDALPGRGGISVVMKPKISEGLQGVVDYMRTYPYVCLEQRTSKAVALRDRGMWKSVMGEMPAYLDRDGLAKYFPTMLRGSDALSSYLLSISNEAGYDIPGDIRAKMLKGLKEFVQGKIVRYSSLRTADLSIRKMAAVEALSRYGEASPDLLTSIDIDPKLWPTSAVLDWINVLRRMTGIGERDRKMKEAENILRGRLNLQGTAMGLSTERSDYLWWLMVSTDLNSARTLLAAMEFDKWKEDVPRIVRGLAGRMKKGRWDTTVANAWGVLAMEKFSGRFEATPVSGVSTAQLCGKKSSISWADEPKGGTMMFPWPAGKGTVHVDHQGTGRPWVTIQSIAAIPLKAPFSSGYRIKKTVTPVERKTPGIWTRGDVMRVRLEIDAQSDMTWVVLNDPVPAGSVILGSGLGRDSAMLSKEGKQRGWAWEAYRERSFEALRVYYEFVPKGVWTVEYNVRLNNDGVFRVPETRVEALYAPEMFGELPNGQMEIRK